MDFFDPQKQKRHTMRLAIGYALVGLVLVLATTILLYQAYGFGLDKQGKVIQNGLVFVSSQPDGADIFVNGQKYRDGTNTRMSLPSGQYIIEIKKDGYSNWKRAVTVEGGSVQRFDYPMLFPTVLDTEALKQYSGASHFSTQSPDQRWLLVATPQKDENVFDLYDLTAKKLIPQGLAVSSDILSASSTTTGWQLVAWAKDDRHVLVKRQYDRLGQPGSEYILLDREDVGLSQNLSVAFGFTPSDIELRDGAFDRYYLFDQTSGQIFTASLAEPTPQPFIEGALAFAVENDVLTYVTAKDAAVGKVLVRAKVGSGEPQTIRQVSADTAYLLDMAVYNNKLYLAAGAASENRVFLYKDPIGMLRSHPKDALVPVQILKVAAPTYVAFSLDERFVIVENADRFAVYDAKTDRGYAYQVPAVMDAPQTHATWMDGFRLRYVSGGKVVVFDFDGTNLRTLATASPELTPVFDPKYRFLYVMDPANALTRTALLTTQDL